MIKQARQFKDILTNTLKLITKPLICYQQFYLICHECNIYPISETESKRLKKFFQNQKQSVQLKKIIQILTLVSSTIKHNKQYFYVKFCSSSSQHKISECFDWWKLKMAKNFGSQMRWFDSLGEQNNCRRIKSFNFKKKIKEICKGSQHEQCYLTICQKFPKNVTNQIEWSTFMAVIRQISKVRLPSAKSCSVPKSRKINSKTYILASQGKEQTLTELQGLNNSRQKSQKYQTFDKNRSIHSLMFSFEETGKEVIQKKNIKDKINIKKKGNKTMEYFSRNKHNHRLKTEIIKIKF